MFLAEESMGRSRGSIFFGIILLVVGIIFLVDQFLNIDLWLIVWPVLLILLGLWFLVGRNLIYGSMGKTSQQVISFAGPEGGSIATGTTLSESATAESRPVPSFNRVQHRGFGNLVLAQGDREELIITAPDAIRANIQTEVKNQTLVISYRTNWWEWLDFGLWGPNRVEFHLTMRDIAGLDISGAGNLTCDRIQSPRLDIEHSGAGNITLNGLELEQLKVRQHGAGNATLKGKVTDQDVVMSGAGNYRADELDCHTAKVVLSGVGNANVWVRDTLDINMSGVGNVEYYGSPAVSRHATGVGNIRGKGIR
jgi:hypothetical protein